MERDERTKEIRKAIKLLGWVVVGERVKSVQDKEIFRELSEEFNAKNRDEADRVLKRYNIDF